MDMHKVNSLGNEVYVLIGTDGEALAVSFYKHALEAEAKRLYDLWGMDSAYGWKGSFHIIHGVKFIG